MRSSIARLLGGALGVSLLGLVLPASAQEDEVEVRSLRLQTAKEDLKARVTEDSVTGSDFRLEREGNTVRGKVAGGSVYLSRKRGGLEGLLGGQSVRIVPKREGKGLVRLEGSFDGEPLEIDISPEELSGTVGSCTYDLEYQDEAYQGVRICEGDTREHVWLFVTPGVPEDVSPLLATTLVVLLGS